MRCPASLTTSALRLTHCEDSLPRAGRDGRAAGAAGRDRASETSVREDGRGTRVTPSAMPVALEGAWRVGDVERGGRDPLSAPETPRRGAERGPLPVAGRLSPLHAAETTSAATSDWTNNRPSGRGAGQHVTCERTAQ
jgi:hypothetical protein